MDGMTAAAWVAALGAIGAWVPGGLALRKSKENNRLLKAQNVEIEKSNSIAKKALAVSQEQADRALDTVKWSVAWVQPGVLICTNTSTKHSARQAQIVATLTDAFDSGRSYVWPLEDARTVGPTQQLVAKFAPQAEDMEWARGIRSDTVHFLTCKITWISERGRADVHHHVDIVGLS